LSAPQVLHSVFCGVLPTAHPQREQNFEFGARFLLQRVHRVNTTS
jgi:hypothetical protein